MPRPARSKPALGDCEPAGSLNLLLIKSGGRRILADVGFGAGMPGMGGVLRGLERLGLSPSDIDIVFLTHFHGDHVAGLLDADGKLVYGNAQYVCSAAEWDEWDAKVADSEQAAHQELARRMDAIRPKLRFADEGEAIAPGVSVVALPGHTLGHAGLLIESNGESLLHVVDLLHQPFQFAHSDWHFGFDSDAPLAVKTRQRVLSELAESGQLTLFYHLPFPGLGRVAVVDGDYVWRAE